ncbi:MAG: VOC family protein [Hyphomonadaceae bacterium]|nr:VOC family protein [Hyphomonadaceae bacterium]
MIRQLDHVVIAVRDVASASRAYAALLGATPSDAIVRDGAAMVSLSSGNVAVELMAPAGEGDIADRLRVALDESGEGLKSLVFAVEDIEAAHRRAERVGLAPLPIVTRGASRSFRLDSAHTGGVRLFIIARAAPLADPACATDVLGLDHVVIRTANMDRAGALYGARLGLDMRLDREVMGRRLMFFRCGDAVVEVAEDTTRPGGADLLWGLSWRIADADAAHARLSQAGFAVSEVRAGMKPGTRVFTVRDGTCGVPTLMIELSPKRD